MTEILSDMTKRVPLSVEKEECTGMPSTLKSIMSSPIWDSLYKSIDGKHVPGVPSPPRPPPQRRDTGIRRQVEQGGRKRLCGVGGRRAGSLPPPRPRLHSLSWEKMRREGNDAAGSSLVLEAGGGGGMASGLKVKT